MRERGRHVTAERYENQAEEADRKAGAVRNVAVHLDVGQPRDAERQLTEEA
jgi:hypothetical protein